VPSLASSTFVAGEVVRRGRFRYTPLRQCRAPAARLSQIDWRSAILSSSNLPCLRLLAAALVSVSSGCASLVSGRHAEVAINSNPRDAYVTVHDKQGRMVAAAATPAVVTLKRGDGFFRRASYTATIEKPGYQTAQLPIDSRLNPWIFGNVLFGGLVGLAVDPYTGAMWRPETKEINATLVALDGAPSGYEPALSEDAPGQAKLRQASHEAAPVADAK
jgi:hypothetical protein